MASKAHPYLGNHFTLRSSCINLDADISKGFQPESRKRSPQAGSSWGKVIVKDIIGMNTRPSLRFYIGALERANESLQ